MLYLPGDTENYISYNQYPIMADNGSEETVLFYNNKWIILNGDFREEILKMVNKDCTMEHIYAFFKLKHKEFGSSWSTNVEESEQEAHDINWLRQRGFDL